MDTRPADPLGGKSRQLACISEDSEYWCSMGQVADLQDFLIVDHEVKRVAQNRYGTDSVT